MSKANTTLAKKIVEKYAEVTDLGTGGFTVAVPIIGHTQVYHKAELQEVIVSGSTDGDKSNDIKEEREVPVDTTEEEALEMAAADIAKQLDDELISLSDTWAEDHL